MFANVQFGTEELLNQGYDINNVQDEVMIFEPGNTVDGDNGSSF